MGWFGPEKIILTLEKFDYKPGEVIKGNIKLNLKKTTRARKLEVSFIGQKKEVYHDRDGTHTSTVKLFDFNMPLRYEGEYRDERFNFEIKIPDDILGQDKSYKMPELDSTLGKLVAIGAALSRGRDYPIEWLIEVHLDVPMGLDIKKSQKIILA